MRERDRPRTIRRAVEADLPSRVPVRSRSFARERDANKETGAGPWVLSP
jgi:hypothetical protein